MYRRLIILKNIKKIFHRRSNRLLPATRQLDAAVGAAVAAPGRLRPPGQPVRQPQPVPHESQPLQLALPVGEHADGGGRRDERAAAVPLAEPVDDGLPEGRGQPGDRGPDGPAAAAEEPRQPAGCYVVGF